MAHGTAWLAAPRSIAFGGYRVVLARGPSPEELAGRLATTVSYDSEHIAVAVGEHTGESLLELMDDTCGDPATAARLQERLTAAGLPDPERDPREAHRTALGVVEELFALSPPREPIVGGTLPAVLLEPAQPRARTGSRTPPGTAGRSGDVRRRPPGSTGPALRRHDATRLRPGHRRPAVGRTSSSGRDAVVSGAGPGSPRTPARQAATDAAVTRLRAEDHAIRDQATARPSPRSDPAA